MWKLITTAFLAAALFITTAGASESPFASRAEAAAHLDKSAVSVAGYCSGTMIGPREYLTAKHCLSQGIKIEYEFSTLWPKSIEVPLQEKEGPGGRSEDWAIVRVTDDAPEGLSEATLGCTEEIYVGMPVATMGYPTEHDRIYLEGYVSGLKPVSGGRGSWNLDFTVDMRVGSGSSGGGLISLDTGDLVGVVIERTFDGIRGQLQTGIESVKNLDICENAAEKAKADAEKDPGDLIEGPADPIDFNIDYEGSYDEDVT